MKRLRLERDKITEENVNKDVINLFRPKEINK